jgi:hypothetical protein
LPADRIQLYDTRNPDRPEEALIRAIGQQVIAAVNAVMATGKVMPSPSSRST